jgi:lysophospholipase L1-like esterase
MTWRRFGIAFFFALAAAGSAFPQLGPPPIGLTPASATRSSSNPTAFPGLTVFGSSISNPGTGSTTQGTGYAYEVAADLGLGNSVFMNNARSGDEIADAGRLFVLQFTNPQYTRNSAVILEHGVNDVSRYTTTAQQANYQSFYKAAAAWLAMPQSSKVFGQACTKTSGSWTNDITSFKPLTTLAVQSTTNGSVLTCSITTTGPTLYLAYRKIDGDAGAASVTVDGSAVGTLDGSNGGGTILTQNGVADSVGVFTTAVVPGAHTVVVTVTSATGAGNIVSVEWLGSAPAAATSTTGVIAAPVVYALGVLRNQNGANDVTTALFDGFNQSIASALKADGLNVNYVDIRSRVNPSTQMFDTLHPNQTGHNNMRDAIEYVMNPAVISAKTTPFIGSATTAFTGIYQTGFDNFNRANGAIGSNWTVIAGGFNVSSNQVQGTFGAQNNIAYMSAVGGGSPMIGPDQFCQVTVTALNGTTDYVGCVVRGQDSTDYYDCAENTTAMVQQMALWGYGNSVGVTGAVGDVIRGEVSGTVFTCYQNGIQIAQVSTGNTGGQIPPGQTGLPGLIHNGIVAALDNFSGGNLHPISQLDVESDYTQVKHFLKNGGHCTMATTTCTITITQPPTPAANNCLVTVQGSTPIAGACSISGTTLTITAASSNTNTWTAWIF